MSYRPLPSGGTRSTEGSSIPEGYHAARPCGPCRPRQARAAHAYGTASTAANHRSAVNPTALRWVYVPTNADLLPTPAVTW